MANLHLVSNGNRQRSLRDLPTYSPTSLNQYDQCPESFLHERVLKTPASPDQGNDALAKGAATHTLMERYIPLDPAGRQLFIGNLVDKAVRALAEQGLPASDTPEHAQAVADVVAWATNGIDIVETKFADAIVLIGEQFLDFRWEIGSFPFRLLAKVDVLAVYPGGVVESLDWKTGAPRRLDRYQNVICRIVAEANAARLVGTHLPGGQPAEIRTTVAQITTPEVTDLVFDHDQLIAEFTVIRDQITRIEQAKSNPTPGSLAWRPQPGWRCQKYCRFMETCSYHTALGDGSALAWLHAALDLPV